MKAKRMFIAGAVSLALSALNGCDRLRTAARRGDEPARFYYEWNTGVFTSFENQSMKVADRGYIEDGYAYVNSVLEVQRSKCGQTEEHRAYGRRAPDQRIRRGLLGARRSARLKKFATATIKRPYTLPPNTPR
jgi:hypothetical protein